MHPTDMIPYLLDRHEYIYRKKIPTGPRLRALQTLKGPSPALSPDPLANQSQVDPSIDTVPNRILSTF